MSETKEKTKITVAEGIELKALRPKSNLEIIDERLKKIEELMPDLISIIAKIKADTLMIPTLQSYQILEEVKLLERFKGKQ